MNDRETVPKDDLDASKAKAPQDNTRINEEELMPTANEEIEDNIIQEFLDEDFNLSKEILENIDRNAKERKIRALIYKLKLTRSKDSEVIQNKAVLALSKIGKPAISLLISALTCSPTDVIWGILEALGHIKDKSTIDRVVPFLKYEDFEVRELAAGVLGEIGDKKSVPALIEALEHDDFCLFSCRDDKAINELIDPDDIRHFVREKWSENQQLKFGLVSALGAIGGKRVITALRWAVEREESMLLHHLKSTLNSLETDTANNPTSGRKGDNN